MRDSLPGSCYNQTWQSLQCWTYFTHQHSTRQEFRELLGISFLYCNISRLVLLECYFNTVVKRLFIPFFLRWKQTSAVYMWKRILGMVASAANPNEIWNQDAFFLHLTQVLLFLFYLLSLRTSTDYVRNLLLIILMVYHLQPTWTWH